MTTTISLERLLQLRVPVTWHEAVAVSQQVGLEAESSGLLAGLDTCLLASSGAIELARSSRAPFSGHPTIGALGALLDRAQAPRELVAVLEAASGATPEAIVEKLQFFARPDAPALIAALAQRALAAEAEASQRSELERLRAEVSAHAPVTPPPSPQRRGLMPWALGAGAIAAAGVALALATGGTETAAAPTTTNTSPQGPSAIEKISGSFDSLVDKGMAALGFSAAPAAAPAEPTKAAAPRREPRLARRADVATESAPLVVILPPEASNEPATRYTAEVEEETDFMVAPEMVHEAGGANLQPPVLRWPQLPQEPESQPVEAGAPYLEILINEGGTVDKVRLRATRVSFHERMLVSAAKAWVFHPAQKGGRPVKYLMKVPILAQ